MPAYMVPLAKTVLSITLLIAAGSKAAVQTECKRIAPSDCTEAIDATGCGQVIADAVASCSSLGGGTVLLAAGVFRFGAAWPEHAWKVTDEGNDVDWCVQCNVVCSCIVYIFIILLTMNVHMQQVCAN